jgi:hypothetical protein
MRPAAILTKYFHILTFFNLRSVVSSGTTGTVTADYTAPSQ